MGLYYGVQSGIAAYDAFSEGDWVNGSKRLIDTVDVGSSFIRFAAVNRALKALAGPLKRLPKGALGALDDFRIPTATNTATQIPRRISPAAMAKLQQREGVEFALV